MLADRLTHYSDPTGNAAAANVDNDRDLIELSVVAGMAISSLLSRHATDEQCIAMMIGLSRWWHIE